MSGETKIGPVEGKASLGSDLVFGFQAGATLRFKVPGVGRDHRCRWMHFSADIEQNLMGSARLTEANP